MNKIIACVITATITTLVCFLIKDYKETEDMIARHEAVKKDTDELIKAVDNDIYEMKRMGRKLDDLINCRSNRSVEQLIHFFAESLSDNSQ